MKLRPVPAAWSVTYSFRQVAHKSLHANFLLRKSSQCANFRGMSNLRTYLKTAGIRQAEMAGILGISRGYMSELANGDKAPSRTLAVRIAEATGGKVDVTSWDHNSLHANPSPTRQRPTAKPAAKGRCA